MRANKIVSGINIKKRALNINEALMLSAEKKASVLFCVTLCMK